MRWLVLGDVRRELIDLHLERRHFAAVLHHVIEIRSAAGADHMDCFDLLFDRADQLLAARDRLVASLQIVTRLLDFRQPSLDSRELALTDCDLRAPLLELFEHSLHPHKLIFAGLGLADGFALPTLHQVEFTEQPILGLFGAHQLFRERLHIVGPFGKLARQCAIGLHELGVSFRKFSDRRAVRFDLVEPTPCRFDVDFECAHVLDEGRNRAWSALSASTLWCASAIWAAMPSDAILSLSKSVRRSSCCSSLRSISVLSVFSPFSRPSSVSTSDARASRRATCPSSVDINSLSNAAWCDALSTSDILARIPSTVASSSGVRAETAVIRSPNAWSACRSAARSARSCATLAWDSWTFQDIPSKRFHILTALTKPIHLRRCLFRERVHVRKSFVESVKHELPSGQLVGLCKKIFEAF